jgi:hypothetical protein
MRFSRSSSVYSRIYHGDWPQNDFQFTVQCVYLIQFSVMSEVDAIILFHFTNLTVSGVHRVRWYDDP